MVRRLILVFAVLALVGFGEPRITHSEPNTSFLIHPGDTWSALAIRLGSDKEALMRQLGVVNPQREPVIGSYLWLHEIPVGSGILNRTFSGGLLESAVRSGSAPWQIANNNHLQHPFSPVLNDLLFFTDASQIPRELPPGFETLSLSDLVATPGQAIALQGLLPDQQEPEISLGTIPWLVSKHEHHLVALGAIDAFFGSGTPELQIISEGQPLWSQPLLVKDREWYYDQVTFPASAATDPAILRQERERLRNIWEQVTPAPLWTATFSSPLREYVEVTSHFGARRSINGGPYDTYHEGTDFSAYRGTKVFAPAGGQVVLAEVLQVRGGSVILDHGLGIHTGYYHLSEINVAEGDRVELGDVLGEVGSTGRSTGNHLHWDFLIGTTWVDPQQWLSSNLGPRIRAWWGEPVDSFVPEKSLR